MQLETSPTTSPTTTTTETDTTQRRRQRQRRPRAGSNTTPSGPRLRDALEHKVVAAFRGQLQAALTAQGHRLAITLAGKAGACSAVAFAAARLT
jgi:hypothetical protein